MPDETTLLCAKARAPDRTSGSPGAEAPERVSEAGTAPAPTGRRRMRLASEKAPAPGAPDALRPGPRVNHDLNLYPEG